jgi:hypothetical protein
MFFNLETGEAHSTGKGLECWMADGNLWFSNRGMEASVNLIPLKEFCDFLDWSAQITDYVEMNEDSLLFALEEVDEETRNLIFSTGSIFLNFNLQVKHLQALAKFLREQL